PFLYGCKRRQHRTVHNRNLPPKKQTRKTPKRIQQDNIKMKEHGHQGLRHLIDYGLIFANEQNSSQPFIPTFLHLEKVYLFTSSKYSKDVIRALYSRALGF